MTSALSASPLPPTPEGDVHELLDDTRDNVSDDGGRVELPQLDEDDVNDLDTLTAAVEGIVANDLSARRLQAQVAELCDRLQATLAPTEFAIVLQLAEVTKAGTAEVMEAVARWAWAEGHRVGREEE